MAGGVGLRELWLAAWCGFKGGVLAMWCGWWRGFEGEGERDRVCRRGMWMGKLGFFYINIFN